MNEQGKFSGGARCLLSGLGDLGMNAELRPYIRTTVEIIKQCKSGLFQVRAHDGTLHRVPKRNLKLIGVSRPSEGVSRTRMHGTASVCVLCGLTAFPNQPHDCPAEARIREIIREELARTR